METLIGKQAPQFKALDQYNQIRSLEEFKGKKVVLYFYPKDNTPGCTQQACNLRDNYDLLKQMNIAVIGVSFDSPQSHQSFSIHNKLPFTIISDSDKSIASAYGATNKFFANLIPKRISFLIDEKGIIRSILKDIDVANHAAEIIAAYKQIN